MDISIYLGENDKENIIHDYLLDRPNINKVCIVGDDVAISADIDKDCISFQESIQYVHYYRYLQKIDMNTLFVWNEAMRTANRYSLNYNCMRKYAQQTPYRLIFQRFPIIHERDDFLVLWDMTRDNPFLKEAWNDITSFDNVIIGHNPVPVVNVTKVDLTNMQEKYQKVKKDAIAAVVKDPDIIPRRLLKFVEDAARKKTKVKFDTKSRIQPTMHVSLSDLKVDVYYMQRLQKMISDIHDVLDKAKGLL